MAVFLFHYYNIQLGSIENVFFQHWADLFKRAGYLGVDFFFTLSGFLITSILLPQNSFDLRQFYVRRWLRLVPLYLLIVLISYLVLPLIFSHQPISLPPLGYVLSFSANYFYTVHGDHYLFAITLLWSISVEMQFYLFWGGLLRFFKQYLYVLAIFLILLSLLLKYFLYGKCSLYYLTASYIPDFMIGAIGAKLIYEHVLNLTAIQKWIKLSFYVAVLSVFVLTPYLKTFYLWQLVDNCVYATLTMAVILDQCADGSLIELGRSRLISYLGKVSYGIYCFQGFVLPLYSKLFLAHFMDSPAVVKVVLVPLCLFVVMGLLAAVSYRYFESYFSSLRSPA